MLKNGLLLFLAFCLTATLFNFKPLIKELEEEQEGPQWFEQWFEMKKDATGSIPILMNHKWAMHDLALNKTNGSSILDSVQNIGPGNIGGRTRAIVVDWSDTTHYFAGSVAGGLWESKDQGLSWRAVNDNQENLNITAITQSTFNKNTYYYCTGEPYPINDASSNTGGQLGGGVFKSTDGGKTFSVLASTLNANFTTTWDIKLALNDSNTLYVATENKGLFKSTDGGTTFTNVFPSTSGINRIEVFPNGSIMISRRNFGIYKSNTGDAGTFNLLNNGFPTTAFGLTEFSICKNFPNVMLAVVSSSTDASLQGTYKSSNGGASWKAISNPSLVGFNYTWFCLTTAICPTDTNKFFVGSVAFGYSTNSGQTWSTPTSSNSHSDYHILYNVPGTNKVLCGNDGGIFRYDWKNMGPYTNLNNNYTVTQYYSGSFFRTGLSAIMGAQDNGSHRVLDADRNYVSIQGGDGCFNGINQTDDTRGFVSYQNASIFKVDNLKLGASTTAMTMPSDSKWFINPLELNPTDGDQIYFPSKSRVYRSTGGNFTSITVASSKQPYALGISAETNPVLYYGGSSMLLERIDSALTTIAGKEKDLNPSKPASLGGDFIGCIKVHPTDRNTIFITLTNYAPFPRVWKISNTNTTPVWTDISGNLPQSLPCNSFEVDPLNPNTGFVVATDFGLYTTNDGGTTWVKETQIPNVCIYSIKLRSFDRRLFVFTHGRGVWTANVTPYPTVKPSADFTLSNLTVCEGDPVTFNDFSKNMPSSYLWTFQNGSPATSSSSAVTTRFSGSGVKKVKLVVTNSFGSDSIEKSVTVLSNPKPGLTRIGNTIQSTITSSSYTWYINNSLITGNTQSVPTDLLGWYKVKINNGNGCFATSDSLQIFAAGINSNSFSGDFYFFPNPVVNYITVHTSEDGVLKIFTLDGKLLQTSSITRQNNQEINISSFTKGIYILNYTSEKSTKTYKFLKL